MLGRPGLAHEALLCRLGQVVTTVRWMMAERATGKRDQRYAAENIRIAPRCDWGPHDSEAGARGYRPIFSSSVQFVTSVIGWLFLSPTTSRRNFCPPGATS